MSDSPVTTLRLDKWLWHARFARTRSLAAKLVSEASFRINGNRTEKAHHPVRPGDVLTFPLGPHIRVIKVLALGARRGPAPEARLLYEDLDPPQLTPRPAREPLLAAREEGAGRPTKRERRAIDRLHSDE
ncbi:RNA-binding S4 domain-containing protein [Dongia sedimenti]|uniref:RNA-binding S4 domain-containing protein n=1 Tax=Dongia sedimenti TaxID=3064282 RepID=A0ABU0YNR9_9PROT|nr:RNA-binding S4 domain-containing protein [Rhodospirillaceae bacterium R-7]